MMQDAKLQKKNLKLRKFVDLDEKASKADQYFIAIVSSRLKGSNQPVFVVFYTFAF